MGTRPRPVCKFLAIDVRKYSSACIWARGREESILVAGVYGNRTLGLFIPDGVFWSGKGRRGGVDQATADNILDPKRVRYRVMLGMKDELCKEMDLACQ